MSEIILANGKRIATVQITEDALLRHYQRVVLEESGQVASMLARHMTNSTPSIEMALAHGSATAYNVQPAASEVFRISGLKMVMVTATAPAVGSFGDIAALTTGITLKHVDDTGDVLDLLNGETINTNEQLAEYAEIELPFATMMVARFKFPGIVRVEGTDDSERLAMTLDDDLSGLTSLRVFAEGFIETTRN